MTGGATILMEHRYWGDSSPYSVLSTENLTYLTLENSIKDTTYFANNVQLPFDSNGSSNAQNAPWVMAGGSYSGALTGWVASVDPGTYWAYYATSAVVEAVYDFVSSTFLRRILEEPDVNVYTCSGNTSSRSRLACQQTVAQT